MAEWSDTSLAEVVALQRGHDLPTQDRRDGNVPIVGSFGITGWHDTAKASGPGVTIGRSGASFGTAAYVATDFWPLNTCLYVTDFKGNDPRYVYALLHSIDFSGYNSGSAQPSLNRNLIGHISVSLPPIAEQRRIAAILSSLDDLIDCNDRLVRDVQDLAQSVFCKWFVDLQPFGGTVPDDWKQAHLGGILDVVRTATKPGAEPDLPYAPIDSLPMHSLALRDVRPNEDAKSSLCIFEKNDILIGAMRVYFHRVALAPFRGITRNTTFVLRAKQANYLPFALLLCNAASTIEYANATSKGSTMPYAVWEGGLAEMPIYVPSPEVLDRFQSAVWPLIEYVRDSLEERERLIAARDELLPLLLSGKLRTGERDLIA